jgi:polyprenyl-phospho-N-acetylgalactosaminyl synthase
MKVLVVIPAFNEAPVIGEVIKDLKSQNSAWDVLVVDDGSRDETYLRANAAGAIVLRHKINRGQGAAVKTGIEFALNRGYQTVVFFDADGQMSAAEVGGFLDKIAESYDVVLGSRNLGQAIAMPVSRRLIKKLALWFSNLTTGLKLTDTHNGFQAWRIEALRQINLTQDRYAYASQLLSEISRLNLKYCEIPVTIKYTDYSRQKGQSWLGAFNVLWDLFIK